MFGSTAVAQKISGRRAHLSLVPALAAMMAAESDVHVGGFGFPVSRQGRPAGRPMAFTPDFDENDDVHVGAQNPVAGCATIDDVDIQEQIVPCQNNYDGMPTFAGSGDVVVPAGGTATASIVPVDFTVMIDYGIDDPSGLLQIVSMKAGRLDMIQNGTPRTPIWQAQSVACKKFQKPIVLQPWSGFKVTFLNSTGNNITVNTWAAVLQMGCKPATQTPSTGQ